MESNYLRDIPDLIGVREMAGLLLSRNRIKTVAGSTFMVRNIWIINLASNQIQHFNFSGVAYDTLVISNNSITRIEKGLNSYIFALFLQRNTITSLAQAGADTT